VKRLLHLVRRFFASLLPIGPSADDDAWAREQLSDAEQELWARMARVDRRHSAAVARQVAAELGEQATGPVLTAALLHDVGKTIPHLGTFGRVVATLSEAVAGEDTARHWVETRGFTRRVGQYVLYPELGVDLLRMAGSDDLVIAWSREHHLPEDEWTVPVDVGRVLQQADDAG
jgi:HD-like signal output (HDOD) protein